MKKFEKGEILRNVVKTHPRSRFFCYNGQIYYNNTEALGARLNDFMQQGWDISFSIDTGILLESGAFLLTEDGDYILIE